MVAGYQSNMVETLIIRRPFQITIQNLITNVTNYIKYTKSEEKEKYTINAPSGPRT
jgi:hypothetical protein